MSLLLAEDVADPANGVDQACCAVRLGLASQGADEHLERVRRELDLVAPHLPEHRRAVEDAPRVAKQELEQRELDASQLELVAAAATPSLVQVELEVGVSEDAVVCRRPPEQRAQAG